MVYTATLPLGRPAADLTSLAADNVYVPSYPIDLINALSAIDLVIELAMVAHRSLYRLR